MRNVAVILAGGTGSRVGGDGPKQFLRFGGRTVIEHAVDAFDSHEGIDEVAVVMHPDHLDTMRRLARCNHWRKVRRLLPGGSERHLSTLAAIEAYRAEGEEVNLVLHDAARPLVSHAIISRVVEALREHEAVDVAVPTTDTIFTVSDDGRYMEAVPERRMLRRSQTPQAFRLSLISKAYRLALQDPAFSATDDCGTLVRYLPDVRIRIVEGEERNMKLTYPDDIPLFERLFQNKEGR